MLGRFFMGDVTGKRLGTWEGMIFDSKIKAGPEIGKGFPSQEAALAAARENPGAEVLIQGDDKQIHLHQIDDGSRYAFTRDNIAQVKGYSVSNVSTQQSEVKSIISFVTEDDYEAVSPAIHQNPFSGNAYVFQSDNKVSAFIGKSPTALTDAMKANTTQNISRAKPPASIKGALEPTLKLLEMYDSKAADWLRKLGDDEYALAGDGLKTMGQTTEIYAAWTALVRDGAQLRVNDMILGDNFWSMNDIDKASALYHEYVHAVDEPVMRTVHKVYGTIEGLVSESFGDKAEDKAYLAQWGFLKHFGITSGEMYETVKGYMDDRKLDYQK